MTKEVKEGRKRLILSPSLRYEIETTDLDNGPGYWNYLRVVVTRLPAFVDGAWTPRTVLATFERNYGTLCHSFFRYNGCEYFQSGRTYMSQLFVNLDTGDVYDTSTMDHVLPHGPRCPPKKPLAQYYESEFCWVAIAGCFGNVLVVDGCFWGGPYEYICYDFADPARGPRYMPIELSLSADDSGCAVRAGEDGTFIYERHREFNAAHNEFEETLTDDLYNEFYGKRTAACETKKERDGNPCLFYSKQSICASCLALHAEEKRLRKEIVAGSVPLLVTRYVLKRDEDEIVCLDQYECSEEDDDE